MKLDGEEVYFQMIYLIRIGSKLIFRPRDPEPYSIQYGSVKVSATNERSVPVSVIVCNKYTFHNLPLNDIAVLKVSIPRTMYKILLKIKKKNVWTWMKKILVIDADQVVIYWYGFVDKWLKTINNHSYEQSCVQGVQIYHLIYLETYPSSPFSLPSVPPSLPRALPHSNFHPLHLPPSHTPLSHYFLPKLSLSFCISLYCTVLFR